MSACASNRAASDAVITGDLMHHPVQCSEPDRIVQLRHRPRPGARHAARLPGAAARPTACWCWARTSRHPTGGRVVPAGAGLALRGAVMLTDMPPLAVCADQRHPHGLLRGRAQDRRAAAWCCATAGRKWRSPGGTRSRRWRRPASASSRPTSAATAPPTVRIAVEAYDLEQLTADLVGLLDHLRIDRAVFVGHDWGGFVVWQMPLRHRARVAGVVGINTPHVPRAPVDPIQILRKRFGELMYIVQFQAPGREVDALFDSHVEQTFDCFMRKPLPRPKAALPTAARRRRRTWPSRRSSPPTTPPPTRARRSCRPRRSRSSSTPSAAAASPAASTGTAT